MTLQDRINNAGIQGSTESDDRLHETGVYSWPIVRLAREMCRCAGHDPDAWVVDAATPPDGPFNSIQTKQLVPAWTLYAESANVVINRR